MKETQSDFVFHFRRNSSRYSFSSDRKGDHNSNVQLKRASWSSFPHLKLSSADEKAQKMEAKTALKSCSSENLKKPHKLVKSKSTSFFKTTSSFKNFFASAFSSTHSSSAASVISTVSSASSSSSSSIPSSPKTRSSWSSGVTHILERERSNNNGDDYIESASSAPTYFSSQRPISNGLPTRKGSLHMTASLLEEDEEDDEMIMNTPKIICAHKKTPDVEKKTRRQIAQELELIRQLGKLPGDSRRQEMFADKNGDSYYENLSNLKGYKPKINNINKTVEEALNERNLKNSGFLSKTSFDDRSLYATNYNNPLERSKSMNNSSEYKDKSVQRISLSTPQDGVSDKIENQNTNSYQDEITYNPLVVREPSSLLQRSDSLGISCNDRNVILDMLNYTGIAELTDEDSDCDSSDVMMNVDDDSSCFEKCLEDNLEKFCDKEYSRENSTFSVYSLKENFLVENCGEVSFCEESFKEPRLNDNLSCRVISSVQNSLAQVTSEKDPSQQNNLLGENLNSEKSLLVDTSDQEHSSARLTELNSKENVDNSTSVNLIDDAKDAAEEKVQLRKKNRPNLQLNIGKSPVHKVLSNEKVLKRITENEIEFGAKSPKTPKSPAIDIDECFKERQQKLKDNPKDNLTKVKDLTQRLRLPLEQPTYLQWLNIPNKESAVKLANVISPPIILIDIAGQFSLQEKAVLATEEQRSKNITNALLWIKDELVKMKQQDQQLASQLVHLQLEMQRLRLVRSCTQHEALLEEVTCEEEEQKAYMTSTDFYDPPNSLRECAPSVLRDIGVTRMNIASRRFTLR